jgi:hypothetical protein
MDTELKEAVEARRLLSTGYIRVRREETGATLRQMADLVNEEAEGESDRVSDVCLLRWERAENVPRRKVAAAVRYVALIRELAAGSIGEQPDEGPMRC